MLLLKMRSGIFSSLFLGFLLLGGAGLVLMDWTGSYKATGMTNEVAVIDGHPIRTIEFDRFVQRVLRTQNMDARTAYNVGLIDQILELQITDTLLSRAAREFGIVVDDKTIASQISKMLEPMAGKDGSKKETLARLLQSQGMSEADLVNNLRQDMSRKLVTQAITGNIYIPALLASDLHAYRTESRDVEAVRLLPASVKDLKAPTTAELEEFYSGVMNDYAVPEGRSFTVAVLSPDLLAEKADVSDDEVKAYYDENIETYQVEERRLLQQAVLDSEAKAADVLKQAQSDKNGLEAAVKAVTGNAKAYTGESGFERNGLPEEMGNAIFSASEGAYAGPFKSALGWHVIFIKQVQPAQTQPFDKVKDAIRKELQHNQTADSIYAATSRIEDRLAGGETLEDIAKSVDMSLLQVKDVRLETKTVEELKSLEKDQENILRTAFGLQEGESSPLSDLSDGRMYAVRMDSIKPRRIKTIEEIGPELSERWKSEQQNKANAAYAKQKIEEMNSLDGAAASALLGEIAKEKGSKKQLFSGLTRESKPENGLSEANLGLLMSASKNQAYVFPATDGIWIARVVAVKIGDKTPEAKDLEKTRDLLVKDGSQENLLILVNDLQTRYKYVKNEKVLERLYGGDPENP